MQTISSYFDRPRFRNGVSAFSTETGAEIDYRDQGCVLSLHPDLHGELKELLELLRRGGMTIDELRAALPSLSNGLQDILDEFDRLGLLTESNAPSRTGRSISGRQFHRQLVRFIDRQKARVSASQFFRLLKERRVSQEQLVGYAVEYYHVVNMCPQLLGPSLANVETRRTSEVLRSFYVAELYHDRLMARALHAMGIDDHRLSTIIPLPSTFAVCSSLGVLAKQHPLSFKAALFVFETPYPEFVEEFEHCCRDLGLPDEFISPFIEHSDVNGAESHEAVSEELFAEIALVSEEEQNVVKKNMAILIESLIIMEGQILEYYGRITPLVPRSFR